MASTNSIVRNATAWCDAQNATALNFSPYAKGAWIHDDKGRNYTVVEEEHWGKDGKAVRLVTIRDEATKQTKEVPTPELFYRFHMGEAESCRKCGNAVVKNADYSNTLKFILDSVKPYMDKRLKGDSSWRYPMLVITVLRKVCDKAVMSAGRYDGKRPPHRIYDIECEKNGYKFQGNLIVTGLLHRDDIDDVSAFDEYDMTLSLMYAGKVANAVSLNFSPGDKVSIVDTDIRYGGDKGEVVRKDGFRYVVRLTSRQDKPEVLLQPNQLKAANSEDAQGHEHGSDGKFASKGGGSDGGDSYEDPKTKRMKERLAKMREKNEALRKEIDQRKAALAGKKEETEKMRADVMKANVEKWKAGLPKTTNSVVAKALNAVAKNADEYVIRKAFTPGKWFLERKAKSLGDAGSIKVFSSEDEARSYAKSKGLSVVNAVVENAVTDWERSYTIKGLPVKLAYRGSPYNDIKATVEGGNRDWIEVARVSMSNPPSQAEAEKMVAPKWARIKRTAPNSIAKNADDDWVARFEVGGVYNDGPFLGRKWLAKVLSRTDSSIRVAIKSRRDKTWHGKDEQVTLRINKRQAEEDGTEVAKGYGWEFWANDFE